MTLGLYPPLVRDLLHRIVDDLADNNVELRRSIALDDWCFEGVSKQLQESVSALADHQQIETVLPQTLRAFRDDVALAGSSSAHGVATVFGGMSSDAVRTIGLQSQRYLGHETLDGVLYCRTFGQVLEFRSPHRERVEDWLLQGKVPETHFLGPADSPDPGGQAVLESLLQSGLALVE